MYIHGKDRQQALQEASRIAIAGGSYRYVYQDPQGFYRIESVPPILHGNPLYPSLTSYVVAGYNGSNYEVQVST